MGTRKCQNLTSQLDISENCFSFFFFNLYITGAGWYDKWGGEKRRNIFQGETLNQFSPKLAAETFRFSCCLLTLATWQMMKNIRPNQRPGRTFVCWSWGSSGRRTRRSSSKLCSRWSLGEREPVVLIKSFSVYVRHRPPSRWLQGKKIQGVMPCD